MEFNKYQFMSKRTLPHQDFYKNDVAKRNQIINFLISIGGEVGELQNIIKKELFHGHESEKDKLIDELGDILWYLAGIATTLDIQLDEVAEKNLTKLSKRYKNGFSVEDSKKRVDVQ